MGNNRYLMCACKVVSVYMRQEEEMSGKVSVFGDSILKGVQPDPVRRRYSVNDNLGLGVIASRYGLSLQNFSKLGCTITKAWFYVQKMFSRIDADMVLMNFGGNDCDFNWARIAENPMDVHTPNTEIGEFSSTYASIVDHVKARRRMPVLSTLVPVQKDKYIDYICRKGNLDRANVDLWIKNNGIELDSLQGSYSDAVATVARSREIPLLDVRSAFMSHGNVSSLMCEDGIHPNARGQKLICDCFESFMGDYLNF